MIKPLWNWNIGEQMNAKNSAKWKFKIYIENVTFKKALYLLVLWVSASVCACAPVWGVGGQDPEGVNAPPLPCEPQGSDTRGWWKLILS